MSLLGKGGGGVINGRFVDKKDRRKEKKKRERTPREGRSVAWGGFRQWGGGEVGGG